MKKRKMIDHFENQIFKRQLKLVMVTKRFFFLFFTCGFLYPLFVHAQTKDTVPSMTKLEDVMVTAHRFPQNHLSIPFSSAKINQQQFTTFMVRTTPDALSSINGVFVQKTNLGGGSPFIRGLTGNQTLTLIDGIRLNNSTFRYGPNQYLNTIDPFSIQKIEVISGTGAVQYGSDALGGVIQIFTHEPQFSKDESKWQGKVFGKLITDDMEKTGRGEIQYASKRFAFVTGITQKKIGDLVGGDTSGKQSPSGYSEWSTDMKAKILIHKNSELTIVNQFLVQDKVPVYHKVVLEKDTKNEMEKQQRWLAYARFITKNESAFCKQLDFTISFQQSNEIRNIVKNGSVVNRRENDEVNTLGLTSAMHSEINAHWTAISGIEFYTDKVYSNRKDINTTNGSLVEKRGLYPNASSLSNLSIYSLHHFTTGKWLLDAGIRFNQVQANILDTLLGEVKNTTLAWVANASVLYRANQNHSIYLAFSNGYRAPNIDDMGTLGLVDFRYELPTADLRPEKSLHGELGYKWSHSSFSGNIAFYHMQLYDLITRVKQDGYFINTYQVYSKKNTEKAYIQGFEAAIRWQWKHVDVQASVSNTFGENSSNNEPLRRIPPFNGRMIVRFGKQQLFVMAEWQFAAKQNRLAQGDKDDNRIPIGGTPGWQVVNLYGSFLSGNLQCNAGLQNLFNVDYRTHGSGINAIGRSLWLSFNFKF